MHTLRQLSSLLSRRERLQVGGLLVLIIVVSFLQVVGIASITPFLALVADPTVIDRNPALGWMYRTFAFESHTRFLVTVGFGVLVAFTVSNLAAMAMTWAIVRFSWSNSERLSRRLLAHYLGMPYVFFLNRNSADLMKNVLSEVEQVVRGVMVPAMQTLARLLTAAAITALLVAVDPLLAAITAAVLGGIYLVIYVLVRRKVAHLGQRRNAANRVKYRAAAESLGGIKEIKLLGREPVFLGRYAKGASEVARARVASATIGSLPHYLVEILAFGGLLLITMYLLTFRGSITETIPVIGLYGFASFRLLPAIREIYQNITTMRFTRAPLDEICRDLGEPGGKAFAGPPAQPLPLREALTLRDVTFRYPNAREPLFQGLSLTIRAGSRVGFVGATGSGKTTLVDIILGLLPPESGAVLVDGAPLSDDRIPGWQRGLGYVPQHIYLSDDTVAHNIAFGVPPERVDRAAVERAARMAHIHDFITAELPHGYDTVVGERGVRLSGGQRQRIGIARALYRDPAVLVLDEATSALDNVTEEAVLRAVEKDAGARTILMIAHRLSTVRTCDVIFLLDGGRIVAQGTWDDLMRTSPQFQKMAKGVVRLPAARQPATA